VPTPPDRSTLKKLLRLVDQLAVVHEAMCDELPSKTPAYARKARELRREAGRILKEHPQEGTMAALLKRHRLGRDHVLVMLELLRQRLHSSDPFLPGREILAVLAEGSFERLDRLRLLGPRSPLLVAGILTPHLAGADDPAELLEMRFRLSDRAFRILLRVLRADLLPNARSEGFKAHGYRGYLGYLMDVRRLALLYQKRAARLFHFDEWDGLAAGKPDTLPLLNKRIPAFSEHIEKCLELTPRSEKFPLVELSRDLGLVEEHRVILVTLVFEELTRGNPFLDAVDLLKLVCRSEQDLVRRRKVLAPDSPLVSCGLVRVEEVVHGKDLSGEVHVPNAVVDRVLGGTRDLKSKAIDEESRREFQEFLKELGNSDDFFRRL